MKFTMKEQTFQKTGGLTYGHTDFIFAKSNRFSSKVYSAKPQFSSWNCSCCGKEVLDDINQRGMKKSKCDSCIYDTEKLIQRIRYWERRVLSTTKRIKTHCINGHEFTKENSIYRNGIRWCRTCRNIHNRCYQRRTKQALKYYHANNNFKNYVIKIPKKEADILSC